jgi:hypothetical protein
MENSYRRCPSCGAVRPAAEFRPAPTSERPPGMMGRWTRCPECRHVAQDWVFRAADPPARTEGAEG